MAPKTCILCGAPGPLTKEHIWPDWYSELKPERRYSLESIHGDEPPTYREATSLDLKPRVLCKPCNNEWGSTLEGKIRPLLEPLSEGRQEIVVTLPAARRLATWAALKFMVAEHLTKEHRPLFFIDKERRWLREKERPPKQVTLWLGRYVGRQFDAGWFMDQRSLLPFADDPSAEADLYVQTISVGQALIQMLAFHVFPTDPKDRRKQIEVFFPVDRSVKWSEALVQLWPLPESRFRWPPPRAVDDAGFLKLARRWHEPHYPGGKVPYHPAIET
jgi:hypothetical protein